MEEQDGAAGESQKGLMSAEPAMSAESQADMAVGSGSHAVLPDPNSITRFDLFSNRFTLITLGLLALMMAYGVTDSLPLGESYVAGYPYWLFGLVSLSVSGIVWALNGGGRVPSMVAIGLALVAGVVGAAAAHPALLRVNAWADSGDTQAIEYIRSAENHFEAAEGDWPDIKMIGRGHWINMSGEVRRTIMIRRGGLGFYQANLTNIKFELEMSEAWGGAG